MSYRCHCTLEDIPEEGFSPKGLVQLTGAVRKFPHRLPLSGDDIPAVQIGSAPRMSISGVQDKISLTLKRGRLIHAEENGAYILKPVPATPGLNLREDVPANEHLTMQIASQIFGIAIAGNACVYLSDDSMSYITRRFDYRDGQKIAQEDFCQLSRRSPESHGHNYKYDGTYEELGRLLQTYCRAYRIEVEKLFMLIVFNYAMSNGDAHLKNFSLYQTPYGDYILTPAYDLLCTSLHMPDESRTALDLFDDYETPFFKSNGYYGREDFMELSQRFGILGKRAETIINRFHEKKAAVEDMIKCSFLSQPARVDYRARFHDRLNALL
jgi:serine/threonine-protein kinase HipA